MVEKVSQPVRFEVALLHPRYWGKWLGIILITLASYLPFFLLDRLAVLLGKLTYRFYEKHRRQAQMNIDWCFPSLDEGARDAMLRAHFTAYLQSLLLLPMLWWGSPRRFAERVIFKNVEYMDDALAKGPVIVLACHSVMLDYGAAAIARRYSAVSMYRPFKNQLENWLVLRARSRFNNRLVARGESLRPLIQLTRKGVPCYHMPDEDLGLDGSVFAPFFGKAKATLMGMAKMTRSAKASVVPCYPHYLGGGRFKLTFLPALAGYPESDEVANALRTNQVIESLISIAPAQYLWKLRLFKTREDGGPNLYKRENWPIEKR